MLDIDHFKHVNDSLGHAEGDAVLRRVASVLGETVRASDLLARYGGEEFALILPETELAGAVVVISLSCGLSRWPMPSKSN